MRIQYGHDYYDKALAHGGHDDPVFFERFKDAGYSEEDMRRVGIEPIYRRLSIDDHPDASKFYPRSHPNLIEVNRESYRVHHLNVFIAGKRYHGLHVEDATFYAPYREKKSQFFWSLDPFLAFLKNLKVHLHEKDAVERSRYGLHRNTRPEDQPLADYFTTDTVVPDAVRDVLISHNISIYLVEIPWDYSPSLAAINKHRSVRWKINPPTLKGIEFFKVMDAYTIYQELEMWIGGVLPNAGRPMVTISDHDKVGKHGFDPKWSFRRHKDDPR